MLLHKSMNVSAWLAACFSATLLLVGAAPASSQQVHPRQEALDRLNAATTLEELMGIHEEYEFPRGNISLSANDHVAIDDFYILAKHFGAASNGYVEGDLNLDGVTDLADLAIMSFNAGHSWYVPDPEPALSSGNLGISLNAVGSVVLSSSSPVHIGALQFDSPSGGLSIPDGATERREPLVLGGRTHSPPATLVQESASMPGFHWVLANEPESVVLAPNLGWSVTLDGDLTTAVQSESNDLTVRWFEKNDLQIHTRRLGEGDQVTGRTATPLFGPIIKPSQPPFFVPKPGVPDDLFFATDEASLVAIHQALNIPRGDLDGDAKVMFSDFLVLAGFYGQEVAGYDQADLNLDGIVSLADYAILSNNWDATEFKPDPPAALPKANLGLWLDNEGQILISSSLPVQLGGIAVESPSGSIELSPVLQQGPASLPGTFQIALTADSVGEQFAWAAAPGTSTELNGTLVTHVTDATDLQLSWFELGSYQVFTRLLGEGDPPNDLRSGFEPYPRCDDPDRDPTKPCVLTELQPVDPPKTFEISLLDEADNLEDLLLLHDDLNIARGDITGSGTVEFTDLLKLFDSFGGQADKYSDGDLNLDGVVDFEDVAILGTLYTTNGFTPELPPIEPQEVYIYFDDDGKLVMGADEVVTIGGIEITSASGGLLPPEDDDPLGSSGPFVHDVRSDSESVVWFTPASSQFANASNGGEVLTEDLVTKIMIKNGTDDLQFRYYLFDSHEVFTGEVELPDFTAELLGDLDGNGIVDFTDFLVLADNFGSSPATLAEGDINGDGQVQFEDFLILAENYGSTAAAASIPEPSGVLMGVWGLAVLSIRRFRRSELAECTSHR